MTDKKEAPACNGGQGIPPHSETQESHGDNSTPCTVQVNDSVSFLKRFRSDGPWVLSAIVPGGKITTTTFRPDQEPLLREWIEARSGIENIYFQVNSSGEKVLTKKASKDEIKSAEWLHVDLDPPSCAPQSGPEFEAARAAILERLRNFNLKPTIIIDSGGGYQGFWKLAESTSDKAAAEAANRWLENELGGDHCHNIDRIMRLPGTINVPNKKKAEMGRRPSLAGLVADVENQFVLSDFGSVLAEIQTCKTPPCDELRSKRLSVDEIEKLPDAVRRIAVGMCDKNGVVYSDRSSGVFALCCEALRQGVEVGVTKALLLDPDLSVSEHVLAQRNPECYADRQIARAMDITAEFDTNKQGEPTTSIRNLRLAMARLDVEVSHDQFARRYRIVGLQGHGPELTDEAERALRVRVEEKFKMRFVRDRLSDIVRDTAFNNGFHPVRNYLDGLVWDGVARVERWLIELASAEDTPYTRAVSRLVLVAAVRRIRRPGSKFDELLVLEGPQGGGKSTALRRLAVQEDWFTDNLPLSGDSKVAIEQTLGKWIIEAGELKGKGRQIDTLKNFLSMQEDRARLAYARSAEDFPRQWVVVGTTNKGQYLHDPTGNRRFWPVAVESFDLARMTPAYVDQLWAEASQLEAEGAKTRLDPTLYGSAAAQQQARQEEDPWEELVRDWVGEGDCTVIARDLWHLIEMPKERRDQRANERIGAIMKRLGFVRGKYYDPGSRKAAPGYRRGDSDAPTLRRASVEHAPF